MQNRTLLRDTLIRVGWFVCVVIIEGRNQNVSECVLNTKHYNTITSYILNQIITVYKISTFIGNIIDSCITLSELIN